MPAHPVPQGPAARLHLPDLLQGDSQLSQQLDLPQELHLRLTVLPIAVLAVPSRLQQPLLLIEAVFFFVMPTRASTSLIFIGTPSLCG